MKLPARFFAALVAVACMIGGQFGCSQSTDVQIADPLKEKLPPPPEPPKPGSPGTKPPAGGGSPPGDPSKYTK